MAQVGLKTLDGKQQIIPEDALDKLRSGLHGKLLLPGEPGYDDARTIWNAMIDRKPAIIVSAADAADVTRAVQFAREHKLLVAIRGGGHNIAGNAVCEGGLMIDLTPMKTIRIDPKARTAYVEPGVTLGEFDKEAQAHGLATPLGINSTTGVAGFTLGGGFGWISRKCGLTIDNLISVDIVTADGKLVSASEKENPELFWAVRGGGANFGVVTAFEFKLHPVGPEVIAGLIVHPFANAKELLEGYRKFVATAPDEVTAWVVLRKAPPLPFLPPEVHGKEIVVFAVCAIGDSRRDWTFALRGLADGVRSAAHARCAELLEVPRLQEARRWVLQGADRRREHLARSGMRDLPRAPGRSGQSREGGRHGLSAPRRGVHHEHSHAVARRGSGQGVHRVDAEGL